MERDYEQQLKSSLSRNVEIPQSVLNKAEGAFDEIRSHRNQRAVKKPVFIKKQWVAAAVAVVFLGLTFNQPVIAAIKAAFWGNHAGIESAVENGYGQEVQTASVKSHGVETKVTNVVIDKSRLGLSVDVKFDDLKSIKNVASMYLDMVITNSQGNVISGDGYPNQPVGGIEFTTDTTNKDSGSLRYNVLFQSSTASIPQTDQLKAEIKSIALYAKDKADKPIKVIEGPWDHNVSLDKQFSNTKGVAYTATNNNDELSVISAELLPTGFYVKFAVTTPNPNDENIVPKAQLVDSTGNIYKSSGMASMSTENNKAIISKVFEVSSFDKVESLNLVLKDISGKDSVVKLVKSTK
ncbi:DUF4179 domain-containing protein [Desulfosporosinus sp. OT]|uniref:DUF4179 domain-containing protein n=1 Tax=Desulfosporosinus sp. OT TaxID=913865 RepID=UPI000223ACF9|nr:DUF4179 domain-containing protein [Desulfosporosinus sp. OT]EGW41779.1 hypothetical protein DOT_0256 [Desulfosporosinus sp. OT]